MQKIYGVGTNDSLEKVSWWTETENGRIRGKCLVYGAWIDMLKRCYCASYLKKYPTYVGCYVCDEWYLFSNFKKWVESHQTPITGMQLDKDLLVEGNKCYSPETCCLLPPIVNYFFLDQKIRRGDTPTGVVYHKKAGKYMARCNNPFEKIRDEYLGLFISPEEAHAAWAAKKFSHAKKLSELLLDTRAKNAIIGKYQKIYEKSLTQLKKESNNV